MTVKRLLLYAAMVGLVGTLAATVAGAAAANRGAQTPATSGNQSAPPAAQEDSTYVIGPEDVIDVSVWKDAELTRVVPVRPDGKISLPLLNDMQAAGLTPSQLQAQISQGLKKYMTDPIVTVIVNQINSQRVYITGEVTKAGAYPLLPQMTMLQALSSAGGFTQFASLKKIYMFRTVDGKQVRFPFNYKDVISGKNTDQNVVLKPGDTIVVP
jgi:polysaccharide biosynthesis/export protein